MSSHTFYLDKGPLKTPVLSEQGICLCELSTAAFLTERKRTRVKIKSMSTLSLNFFQIIPIFLE